MTYVVSPWQRPDDAPVLVGLGEARHERLDHGQLRRAVAGARQRVVGVEEGELEVRRVDVGRRGRRHTGDEGDDTESSEQDSET
jgi:hypothetical protein